MQVLLLIDTQYQVDAPSANEFSRYEDDVLRVVAALRLYRARLALCYTKAFLVVLNGVFLTFDGGAPYGGSLKKNMCVW